MSAPAVNTKYLRLGGQAEDFRATSATSALWYPSLTRLEYGLKLELRIRPSKNCILILASWVQQAG